MTPPPLESPRSQVSRPPPSAAVDGAGWSLYSPQVLRCYDLIVHGLSNRFAWHCPTRRLIAWYDGHVTANHLDIGVGTGYLLDRCRFPTSHPRLMLMDPNPHCLHWAARRLARYAPTRLCASVLEPIPFGGERFDSVGMTYLLHCLPGDMSSKAIVFDHVAPLLRPGGVVFGATLLAGGVPRSWLARRLMTLYNQRQIFANDHDTLAGLTAALTSRFSSPEVSVVGCVALFCGVRGP